MKKVILASVLALSLSACTDVGVKDPIQLPTPAESLNTIPSALPETSPSPTKSEVPPVVEETPKPTPTTAPPTTTDPGTPATQFADRWGKKYPAVPEYAILKAANGTCAVIAKYGITNPIAKAAISEVVTGFGLSSNDAVEFAQDADQNYCSSIVNPT